jgi:DNA-binding NtrC family response regulator
MITRVLETQGYVVLGATKPAEAIRLATDNAHAIRLLLTDVIMPDMNGRELANVLMSIAPHMSRVFMSGYTRDVIADRGVFEDGTSFIEKPFSATQLCGLLRRTLDASVS